MDGYGPDSDDDLRSCLGMRRVDGGGLLDRIGPAEIEAFKARKFGEGRSKKSINDHLGALRKALSVAAECSHLVMRGVSFMAMKEFLGHESAEMSGTATCLRT